MGMHVTIHGKTTESFNGQDGKWIPLRTNSAGQIEIAALSGELPQFNRLAAGAIASYSQQRTSAGATVISGGGILYGFNVVAVGTTPTVTIYDNTTAAGTKLMEIPSASIVAGAFISFNSLGILVSNGIHVVVGGTDTTTINVFYAQ